MPRGKTKGKFDFKNDYCEYVIHGNWCSLPKYKRCEYCIYVKNGGKACKVML
jgi:hypothetical protein